jgi:hypothetical protein
MNDVVLQVAAFCLSAVVSGALFWRWKRLDLGAKKIVWRFYGWFSGLMCCGSCCGAVAWAAWMQVIVYRFKSDYMGRIAETQNVTSVQTLQYQESTLLFLARDFEFLSLFTVMEELEFFFLCAAKLLVLDRLKHVAVPKSKISSRRWVVGARIVMGCFVAGNAVGLGGSIAAAVYANQVTRFAYQTAAAVDPSNVQQSLDNLLSALTLLSRAYSYHSFSEVAVLMFIVASFVVVGTLCASRMRSALDHRDHDAGAANTQQLRHEFMKVRKQIFGTVIAVFLTFVLRAVYQTMFGLEQALQDPYSLFRICGYARVCDSACHGVFTLMHQWDAFTPEFHPLVILISSPLTMLLTLWAMTTERALQLLLGRQRPAVDLDLASLTQLG